MGMKVECPSWWEGCRLAWTAREPIEHRNYVQARARLHGLVYTAMPGEVISLLAPTRNGKSHMIEDFTEDQNDHAIEHFSGQIPAVLVQAANTDKDSTFGAKVFYRNGMTKLHSIFYSLDSPIKSEFTELANPTEAKLEMAFRRSLKAINCKYLIIDEAQHIQYARGGNAGASRFLDSMKTLAEDCGSILILSGTYPLLDVLDLSSHFSGRRFDIFFERYGRLSSEHVNEFAQCLSALTEKVEWKSDTNPYQDLIFEIYEKSMGIFGFAFAIVRASVAEMIARGDKFMEHKHIKHVLKFRQLPQLTIDEVEEGERKLAERQPQGGSSQDALEITDQGKNGASVKQKGKPFRCKPGIKTGKDHWK